MTEETLNDVLALEGDVIIFCIRPVDDKVLCVREGEGRGEREEGRGKRGDTSERGDMSKRGEGEQ